MLVHLLELNLILNVRSSLKLDQAWLGAKHDEDEKDGRVDEALAHVELTSHTVSEQLDLWWHQSFIVCAELEYSRDHEANDSLHLSVPVFATADIFTSDHTFAGN